MNGMTRTILFLTLSFFAAGCAGLPPHYVRVLPAPEANFPPTEPALVRLPVVIIFPNGANVVRHITNLFKNGFKPKLVDPAVVPELHLKFHLTDFWSAIQKPIFLDKNVWLLIRPKTLSVGSARSDPRNILTAHAVLETTSNPEVVFGAKPLTTPMPMPRLKPFIPGPGTFQAVSNMRISYKEVNEHFKDPRLKMIGMVLAGTGQKLTIDGIRMYGSGGKVIVEVKLHYNPLIINLESKPAKLTIYLRGTPRYLPKKRMFDLPDLDYDIKSSDLMLQVADWLFKSDFKKQLRQIARLPVGPKVDQLKGKIDLALNRPLGHFTRLRAEVKSLNVLDGLADNEGILVRVFIEGTATLDVVWN